MLSVFFGHSLYDGAETGLARHGLILNRLADSELEAHLDGSS